MITIAFVAGKNRDENHDTLSLNRSHDFDPEFEN